MGGGSSQDSIFGFTGTAAKMAAVAILILSVTLILFSFPEEPGVGRGTHELIRKLYFFPILLSASWFDGSGNPEPPHRVPIEDRIDLHAFSPAEVRDLVGEYLSLAVSAGFRQVRIIHGRGSGAQRRIVRSLLSRHPLVEGYADAPSEAGGWGATVVRLRGAEPSTSAG